MVFNHNKFIIFCTQKNCCLPILLCLSFKGGRTKGALMMLVLLLLLIDFLWPMSAKTTRLTSTSPLYSTRLDPTRRQHGRGWRTRTCASFVVSHSHGPYFLLPFHFILVLWYCSFSQPKKKKKKIQEEKKAVVACIPFLSHNVLRQVPIFIVQEEEEEDTHGY